MPVAYVQKTILGVSVMILFQNKQQERKLSVYDLLPSKQFVKF